MIGHLRSAARRRHGPLTGVVISAALCASSCSPPMPVASGQWLLAGLRRIADEGTLFEPSRIEGILQLHLETSQTETVAQPAACSGSRGDRSLTVIEHYSHPGWLRPTAEGIKDMPIPAFFINKAGVSGEPTFSYKETAAVACNERYEPLVTREAYLSIGDLPAFACLRRDSLAKLARAKPVQATDGVDMIEFESRDNDQTAATLTFTYRAMAPCALSAEIRQGYKFGYRYQRAAAKWQACYDTTKRPYCAMNGPITWGDGKKLDAMEEAGITSCGSIPSYYNKEPVFGPPLPERRWTVYNTKGPCPED